MDVPVYDKPFQLYTTKAWDQPFRFFIKDAEGNKEPDNFEGKVLEVYWRTSESSPYFTDGTAELTGPGEITARFSKELTSTMTSEGVFDITVDGVPVFKGYTIPEEGVTR